MKIDLFRDAFAKFLAEGMTPLEAYRQFDEKEFRAPMSAELDLQHGDYLLLDYAALAGRERMNERDMEKAYVLWLAGWTSHPVTPQSDVMSWYWRRPPRRKNSQGMLFLSTDQAFNHLQRKPK